MSNLNPSRLVLARKRRGLTKIALADLAGISTRSLTAYESGAQKPTEETVQQIARALRFPVEFFEGGDLDEPSLHAASFRALSKLTATQRDQAIGSAALALILADWIDERFALPSADIPRLGSVDPETAAEAVRKKWNLGQRPIGNMIHTLEAHGVRVFSLLEECSEVDAFSFWRGHTPFIFLNTMKSAERSRMDAAHELGHLVLHWKHAIPRGREMEREAEVFGSAFLMPSGSVLAEAPRIPRLDHLVHAKKGWGVSVAGLTYRMHALGLMSDWQYRSLFIEIGEMGFRRREPQGMKRETSQVLAKVFSALRSEGMTKSNVARSLNLPKSELEKIVFGLTLTGLSGEGEPATSQESERSLRLVKDSQSPAR